MLTKLLGKRAEALVGLTVSMEVTIGTCQGTQATAGRSRIIRCLPSTIDCR